MPPFRRMRKVSPPPPPPSPSDEPEEWEKRFDFCVSDEQIPEDILLEGMHEEMTTFGEKQLDIPVVQTSTFPVTTDSSYKQYQRTRNNHSTMRYRRVPYARMGFNNTTSRKKRLHAQGSFSGTVNTSQGATPSPRESPLIPTPDLVSDSELERHIFQQPRDSITLKEIEGALEAFSCRDEPNSKSPDAISPHR